jgi:hypothetical protein
MYTTKILNISILQEGRKRLELTKASGIYEAMGISILIDLKGHYLPKS